MHDGRESIVTIQSEGLGITGQLLNAYIAVPIIPYEFGFDLCRWCERTSCIDILYIGAAQYHKYYANLTVKLCIHANECKEFSYEIEAHALRTPQK